MIKPSFRGSFGDRNKLDPINTEMQIKDLDGRTRTKLSNFIFNFFKVNDDRFYTIFGNLFKYLLSDVFTFDISKYQYEYPPIQFNKYIRPVIMSSTYDAIFSLIEGLYRYILSIVIDKDDDYRVKGFEEKINNLFKEEYVGYRFFNGIIIPISNDIETNSVKESLETPFDSVNNHINKALRFLSDRDSPDYKNSIKESISGVESICKIIINDEKASLGQALDKLKGSGINIHPALLKAYKGIYGYTSDKEGVRHGAGITDNDVSFEDAKYMLVSCSAFINFLKEKIANTKSNAPELRSDL